MSGYLENLSPQQEENLKEFRKSLSDVLLPKHDDRVLLQFLRARNFDLIKAEEMFRRHLEWRKEFDEDYLVNEYQPHELLVKYMMPVFLGYDKGGAPVRLIKAGTTDLKGIIYSVKRNEIKKFVAWVLDVDTADMRKRSLETGIHIETRVFIFDLKDLSFRQVTNRDVIDLVIAFLKLYEGNYPENLKTAFVINAPPFFAWIFNLIKTLLTEHTIKKIKLYTSGWKEDLLNAMDADILPVSYGGTRIDEKGDPECASMLPTSGPVPTTCYLRNQHRLKEDDDKVQKVVISRRSKHAVTMKVEVPDSVLNWEVDCKNCDVLVSLRKEGEPEAIFENMHVSSDRGLERGCYVTSESGTYLLVMDNSHSLLRSKLILYKTSVTPRSSPTSISSI